MTTTITRYHDFSAGHRVVGHEGKCRNLHGHNYRVHFEVAPDVGGTLDSVGRVVDFSVVKTRLCQWLEDSWDHRMLLWHEDPAFQQLLRLDTTVVALYFNPTAENMARHLLKEVGPQQLKGTGVRLVAVMVEETRKCSARYAL